MKYLVQGGQIVGTVQGEALGLPQGFTIVELDRIDLMGWSLDSQNRPIEPVAVEPVEFMQLKPEEPVLFYGTDTFKKAWIMANKDPLLAVQMTIALAAEQRGDRATLVGSLKAVTDIIKKTNSLDLVKTKQV